jgi:hypothetical protein
MLNRGLRHAVTLAKLHHLRMTIRSQRSRSGEKVAEMSRGAKPEEKFAICSSDSDFDEAEADQAGSKRQSSGYSMSSDAESRSSARSLRSQSSEASSASDEDEPAPAFELQSRGFGEILPGDSLPVIDRPLHGIELGP